MAKSRQVDQDPCHRARHRVQTSCTHHQSRHDKGTNCRPYGRPTMSKGIFHGMTTKRGLAPNKRITAFKNRFVAFLYHLSALLPQYYRRTAQQCVYLHL